MQTPVVVLFGNAMSGKCAWAEKNGLEVVFDYLDLTRVLCQVKTLDKVAITVHPSMPRAAVDTVVSKTLQREWKTGLSYDLYEFSAPCNASNGPVVTAKAVPVRRYSCVRV
tara:strand:+ start:212 stop:544 length:333 start_codon:yes stop_codon:yes gene_type:complete